MCPTFSRSNCGHDGVKTAGTLVAESLYMYNMKC